MKEKDVKRSPLRISIQKFIKGRIYHFIVMGNCFQCFQNQMERSSITEITATPNKSLHAHRPLSNTNAEESQHRKRAKPLNANDKGNHLKSNNVVLFRGKMQVTDGLLSGQNPFKSANYCDAKRGSFKKSIPLNDGNTAVNEILIAGNELPEISDNILNELFEEYKEPDEDAILTEGIERLCHDLNYEPDEFAILVLAWCLDASQMCRFTRSEFIEGLHKMRAHSIDTIRIKLEQTIETLKIDAEMFKQLYRFTFRFGLEPDQRILPLDMAICLWKLVFTVHTPILLNKWIHFLEQHPNIRGIPKDTWFMFLNFSEQCDIYNYDDTEAWPSLFDDFVDYEKAHQPIKSILETCDDDNNNDDIALQYHKTANECSSNYNIPL